ncbi:hypothetical protein VPH35_006031 [Triticum aestivum]
MKCLGSFQRWDAVEGPLFPQLEKLSVENCPKIKDLPEAPNLSVLKIVDGKQEIFHCVDKYLSSLTNLTLMLEYTSILPVDSKEKWNHKSPLTVVKIGCCNSFFGPGALEPWEYFVHLEKLEIYRCDVLVHWPEKVLQSLVSLRTLVIRNCENLTGYAQAPLEPLTSERCEHLRGLESLCLQNCPSLVEMFNVPTSLKKMDIRWCIKLESIFSKQQGMSDLVQGSSSSEAVMRATVSELSSSPVNHFLPCLEDLYLFACGSLPAVLNLPLSLKALEIDGCNGIQVLSCQSGGLQKPEVTTSISRSPIMPEPAATTTAIEHLFPPHLESLVIRDCAGMLGGTLCLPAPLKRLGIIGNSGLTSLECLSVEHPPSLEELELKSCCTLAFLPNEPQVYRSLLFLIIRGCPAIKKLPRCLWQQLGSIKGKYLDAGYEVTEFKPLKPKTWEEIPRLVRERRQASRS